MNSFTISQLQRYSGINVHSIRAWEKRYNALNPGRSEGNTRYYDGNQLRRLLNIASLMHSGYKISELCSFSDNKLFELMSQNLVQAGVDQNDEFLISQMVASALEFNEELFDLVYSRAIIRHSIEGTYLNVLYPVLQRLGVMWSADKIAPAQEHFISNLIRQKLGSAIDMLPVNQRSPNHWILFLPENEFHESGLLMANYLIRNAGHRCTYLGVNVPHESLKEAVQILNPTALLFFFVSKDETENDNSFIKMMMKHFPSREIFVAGEPARLSSLKAGKNLKPLTSIQDLKYTLEIMSK